MGAKLTAHSPLVRHAPFDLVDARTIHRYMERRTKHQRKTRVRPTQCKVDTNIKLLFSYLNDKSHIWIVHPTGRDITRQQYAVIAVRCSELYASAIP